MFAFTFLLSCVIRSAWSNHGLNYSDLEALGTGCGPRDSCESSENKTFSQSSCECDSDCHLYNDCCIDAPPYDRVRPLPLRGLVCIPQNTSAVGVYGIGKCSTSWVGPMEVQRKCELTRDISDPHLASPVTDTVIGITYRSHYCSVCNYANVSNLQSWDIRVDCNTLSDYPDISDEYVIDNLVFKRTYPHRNKWGVYLFDEDTNRNLFHPCRIGYKLPSEMEDSVRFCRASLVSACPPNWRNNTVRQNCGSYMAVVLSNSRFYKNPHCSMCNNVSLDDLYCQQSLLASRSKPPMSFTILLDVNLSDGNRVGHVQRCSTGEKYDPFFKRCRKLVCGLPNYRMVNDKCVPP